MTSKRNVIFRAALLTWTVLCAFVFAFMAVAALGAESHYGDPSKATQIVASFLCCSAAYSVVAIPLAICAVMTMKD